MKTHQISYKTKEGAIITIENFTIVDHIKSVFDLTLRGDLDFTVKVIDHSWNRKKH